MTPHEHPGLPDILTSDIVRLHSIGLSLVPLGGGNDGKRPLTRFGDIPHLPLNRVLAPMYRTGSTSYGIRLHGMTVVDCDDDSPALIADMEARFGVSPIHVKTPRGTHIYYQAAPGAFPNLRAEGLPVDLKRGASSYVVGPQSVRPDGGAYLPFKGVLGTVSLPTLWVNLSAHRCVSVGKRNQFLTQSAISMVELVDSLDELLGNLRYVRDEECEAPDTIPDSELIKIAKWAWSKRLEGNVYHGRKSEFRVDRSALDALQGYANTSDATALYIKLRDQHGHIPGRVFPLDWKAMKEAGHTDLSRRRFRAARKLMEQVGLLRIAKNHSSGKSPRLYTLGHIRSQTYDVANIVDLTQ